MNEARVISSQAAGESERTELVRLRLAAIVESSDDAIIGENLESIITDWNRGAERMFGYTEAEMLGISCVNIIPPDRQDEENFILGKIRSGERVDHFETLRRSKDGRLIPVSITASPIKDIYGLIVGVSKIARDITLQKEHETQLARMTRLHAARSQINQAIVWSATSDGLFQEVCRILVEAGGFCMAWVGRNNPDTSEILPVSVYGKESDYLQTVKVFSDDRPEGRGPTGLAVRTGRPYICNNMRQNPVTLPWRTQISQRGFQSSSSVPIRVGSGVWGVLAVYSDDPWFFKDAEVGLLEEAAVDVSIALDALAEKAARRQIEIVAENERLFSATMIDSMPGILYFYDMHGRFMRWNKNFETVSGYSAAEISQMHPLDFFRDEEKEALKQRIAEVFEKGESFVEAPFLSKDGRTTPYFFTGRRVEFNGSTCLVGVGMDYTKQVKAEKQLRVLNQTLELEVAERTSDLQTALARAEASDRLKSAFLATMSHELRTPLNSIIGFTGIVLQGLAGPLNAEQSKQLGMVRTSARHLLELINDVLDLSKIEAGQLELRPSSFQLRDSLERVLGLVKPMAEAKGLALTVEVSADSCEITSDRRRVEQILLNLVNNAIKFTSSGAVTVRAERIAAHQFAGNSGAAAAIRLSVIDTGVGIKPEDLACLFQPFHQIDSGLARQHEGTGLGLAICQRLAGLLGGEIAVASKWGAGSEFSLVMPAAISPNL